MALIRVNTAGKSILKHVIVQHKGEQVPFPFLYIGMPGNLGDSKTGTGVRMDGERIIKLSGQGSVYIRCMDPLEDENKLLQDVIPRPTSDM